MIVSYATCKKNLQFPAKKSIHGSVMPRPKPSPENEKQRKSVSLRRSVAETAEAILKADPEEYADELTDLVEKAIVTYAEAHHPGLYEEIKRRIRADSLGPVPLKGQVESARRRRGAAH